MTQKSCAVEMRNAILRNYLKSNSPVHTHPMVSGFTLIPRAPLQLNVFGARAIKCAIVAANMLCCCCCVAVLVYCSVRDWTRFCYVIGFENIRIDFFPLWRANLKISGFAVKFAACVWTEAVSGKKKLRIQKYPDTWGQRLNN